MTLGVSVAVNRICTPSVHTVRQPPETLSAFEREDDTGREIKSAAASSSCKAGRNSSEGHIHIRARMLTHTVVSRWSTTTLGPNLSNLSVGSGGYRPAAGARCSAERPAEAPKVGVQVFRCSGVQVLRC